MPITLPTPGRPPRDAALDLLDNWARRHGWYVDFAWDPNAPALPADAPIALYRTLQEALTNVAKHAKAKNVKVLAGFNPATDEFILIVDNDGVESTAPLIPSLGLAGIRERIGNLGGTVKWSTENRHFVLTCYLPLAKENHAA